MAVSGTKRRLFEQIPRSINGRIISVAPSKTYIILEFTVVVFYKEGMFQLWLAPIFLGISDNRAELRCGVWNLFLLCHSHYLPFVKPISPWLIKNLV